MKTSPSIRPNSHLKKTSSNTKKSNPTPRQLTIQEKQQQTVSTGLAICLLGSYKSNKMFDSEYEEEVRKQAVMQEVLPDAVMWKKWEATEAPLRQGRGWYPTLDRHFLELLVVSEIHCLSHPLSVYSNPTAEKVHRHASRVRRVACERIGTERLHAYCDRVKEAFEAYMQGGWGRGYVRTETEASEEDLEGEAENEGENEGQDEGDLEEVRGRGMDREGNQSRRDGPPSPPKVKADGIQVHEEGESDIKMVVDLSPLGSPSPSLSSTDSDSEAESDTSLETASTTAGFGFMDDGERELVKNDLEGVIEVEEEAECDFKKPMMDLPENKVDTSGQMDVDIVLGDTVPTIQIHTSTAHA